MSEGKLFTVVRLSAGATLEQACGLAGIRSEEVDLTQSINEKVDPKKLAGDFRVINFDGRQITISERINGERRVRGFLAEEHFGRKEPQQTKPGAS